MSKASNRNKQYKLQRNSRRNKLERTNRQFTGQSRRSRRTTQLVQNQISAVESSRRSTRYYQPTARSKANRRSRSTGTVRRSERTSRRQRNVAVRTAQLRSVQHAFKSMGVDAKITTANYKQYFKLLEDAKITGGNRYSQVLRIAGQQTDLSTYDGRLFDLVIGKMGNAMI